MKKILLSVIAMVVLNGLFANPEGKEKTSANSEPSTATVSITGQVVDKETGEALTGVYVQIEGTELIAYTDFEGSFSFKNLKPGTYTACATLISYEKSKINLQTTSSKNLKIELETAKNK